MAVPQRTALLTLMRVEAKHVADIKRILAKASRDLGKEIASQNLDSLTAMQARAQKAAVDAYMKQPWTDIGRAIDEGSKQAAAAASRVVSLYEDTLLDAVMSKDKLNALASSEALRATKGLDAALRRMEGSSYVPLSQQVYDTAKLSKGWIDDIINQALVSGWDSKRLAKAVAGSINPNTPGGVSYAANRLARTEINNAFHASSVKRYQDSGLVDAVDWHLSSSHPEGDICDTLQENSPYAVDEVPAKPHPHCYCYLTPALPDEKTFMNNLLSGKYDSEPWIGDVDVQDDGTGLGGLRLA